MSRCPITYREIPPELRYSPEGLKKLSRRLRHLNDLPFSAEEQRQEAVLRAAKMSIQGVQPKLSARLTVEREMFELVDTGGEYILKPQTDFPEVPQNEDLTMHLADLFGIEVPLHGLVYSKDGSLTYFIKRFDRVARGGKLPLEDFAQLTGRRRETKYDSSMEQVAEVLEQFCTFPLVEKRKLFRLTLFNFLVGNEDMHLKNFSLIKKNDKVELSPAYDLLNSTIALPQATEEIALPLGGKKSRLSRALLVDYFGTERLKLTRQVVLETLSQLSTLLPLWIEWINRSFLSERMKERYRNLLSSRRETLGV
ncbi:MAG TPA: HipA domain-containing protein [Bacteroidota bacterium]|nr:HipA domain-containing protein [Bacteroidota bacterium]